MFLLGQMGQIECLVASNDLGFVAFASNVRVLEMIKIGKFNEKIIAHIVLFKNLAEKNRTWRIAESISFEKT